ncbi:hypothetical protein JXO59_09760 [candidate division KSB1 bacterium]|nr:hypothetical protein [candidate division KSB1 bacterium]
MNALPLTNSLTPQKLGPLRLIYLAMVSGVTLLAVVILYFYYQIPADAVPNPEDVRNTHLLVIFACSYGAVALFASQVILRRKLLPLAQRDQSGRTLVESGDPDAFLQIIRTALIIYMAILEGAALLGLVVCLLGTLNGTIKSHPGYWLAAVPYLIFSLAAFKSYPSAENLKIFIEKIVK